MTRYPASAKMGCWYSQIWLLWEAGWHSTSGSPSPPVSQYQSLAPGTGANPSVAGACSGMGACIAPAQPCIRTISNTTSFSSAPIPATGSRIGMTIVCGLGDDCSQLSVSWCGSPAK